jgi:DNA (cytosine-5)-methyltransferase 1
MVLLDLFSGTGGFPLGLIKAGFQITTHYFSEIDPHAIANYSYNFPDAIYAGAVEKIQAKKIKRPDLITFGFPCQDLSAAGRHNGLSGKRSGLFFQAIRLIRELKPSAFIFENVKGLLFSNQGKDFETVLKEIANLGLYDCQWQLLNTSWFLPQNRERIYFVGCLREKGSPKIFPFTESDFLSEKGRKKTRQESENITTALTSNYSKGVHARGETYIGTRYVQYDLNGKGNESQSHRIYHTNSVGPTITRNNSNNLKIFSKGIRRLTPTECERLQGFPDGWTSYGNYNGQIKSIADTNRYKLMGNAVTVAVVREMAKRLAGKKHKASKISVPLNGLQGKAIKIFKLLSLLKNGIS